MRLLGQCILNNFIVWSIHFFKRFNATTLPTLRGLCNILYNRRIGVDADPYRSRIIGTCATQCALTTYILHDTTIRPLISCTKDYMGEMLDLENI